MTNLEELTPKEIVSALDTYIIGQEKAKKAVAIALRNRVRRQKLPENLIDEVAPKNIIMMGPTGVGKTEIARRLSKLTGAPFVKVEATKYTEVGYVGRDVESMVRDLMMVSVNMVKSDLQEEVREEAEERVEDQLLDLLLPGSRKAPAKPAMGGLFGGHGGASEPQRSIESTSEPEDLAASDESGSKASGSEGGTWEKFRQRLRDGKLEDKEVEITVSKGNMPAIEIFSGQSMEEIDLNLGSLGNIFGGKKKRSARRYPGPARFCFRKKWREWWTVTGSPKWPGNGWKPWG
jgi:ATP-dependent HslUV protease ATP-binding subunit HslU